MPFENLAKTIKNLGTKSAQNTETAARHSELPLAASRGSTGEERLARFPALLAAVIALWIWASDPADQKRVPLKVHIERDIDEL